MDISTVGPITVFFWEPGDLVGPRPIEIQNKATDQDEIKLRISLTPQEARGLVRELERRLGDLYDV